MPEETTAVCLPASSFPSATDEKENSESDQNDNKMKIKGTVNTTVREDQPSTELGTYTLGGSNVVADVTKQDQTCISIQQGISVTCAADSLMQTAKKCALMPNEIPSEEIPFVFKSKTQQESQQLTSTPQEIILKTDLRLKHDTGNTNRSPPSSGQRTFSLNHTEPVISDLFHSLNKSLITQQENTEELQKDTTSVIGSELSTLGTGSSKQICVTSPVGFPSMTPGDFPISSEHVATESEAFKINNAQEQEKHCGDITVTPKNVVTIILNMEPQDMQNNKSVGPDVLRCSQEAGSFSADLTEVSSMDCDEKKSGVCSVLNSAAQSDIFETAADVQEKECEDTNGRPQKVYTIVLELKPPDTRQRENVGSTSHLIRSSERAELLNEKVTESYTENPETCELMHNELLNSSKSCHTVSECQPPGANAAETTFPHVKQDEVTSCCHHEEQTMSSVLCTVEDTVQTGNVLTKTQISAGDDKQKVAVNSVQSTGAEHAEVAEELSPSQVRSESKHSEVPERLDNFLLKESQSKLTSLLVHTVVSQRQVHVTAFSVF